MIHNMYLTVSISVAIILFIRKERNWKDKDNCYGEWFYFYDEIFIGYSE